ncbi:arginine--tRNA ligase, partial [Candidatus Roizmanbacteria bacterium]|nr:arginine--tRNA ligase [Candidatus Roizmanbacteria bacterium]
ANNNAPNYICTYLYQLTQEFNYFYNTYPILSAEEPIRNFRITLTKGVGIIVHTALDLLGIETVDTM